MFQHVVSNYDTRFVMKADDDTFINVPGPPAHPAQALQHS